MSSQPVVVELFAPIPGGAEVAVVTLKNKRSGFFEQDRLVVLMDRTNRIAYGTETFHEELKKVASGTSPLDDICVAMGEHWSLESEAVYRVASSVVTAKGWGDSNQFRTMLYIAREAGGYRG